MLTNKAIFEETQAIDKVIAAEKNPSMAAALKLGTLIVKMLSSIRTNQVLLMEKQGVMKLQPKKRPEETETPVATPTTKKSV